MPSCAKEWERGLGLHRRGGQFTGQEGEQMFGNQTFALPCR